MRQAVQSEKPGREEDPRTNYKFTTAIRERFKGHATTSMMAVQYFYNLLDWGMMPVTAYKAVMEEYGDVPE
jgi:hypothetical protein